MAPNLTGPATGLFLAEAEVVTQEKKTPLIKETKRPKPQYEWQIVWRNVIAFIYLHVGAFYGLYLVFTVAKIQTILFCIFIIWFGGMGITAGAHRLWAHRSYKARWPLRLLLAFCNTLAFQNHIYEWARDHRVHHKFTDTDADPHNAKRGFFFSHMGWLMLKKHPDVKNKGKTVDMTDLEKDWVVMFQKKYYAILMPLICFILPTMVPIKLWNEDGWVSWYIVGVFRYTLTLNGTWLVNSAAHIWGMRPYDKYISAVQNKTVAMLAFGEGWHNYHHAFPWDYKTAELHGYSTNWTKALIDFFARIGWAYDLKTAPIELIKKRSERTGDGSREHEGEVWGWGDKDLTKEEMRIAEEYSKSLLCY